MTHRRASSPPLNCRWHRELAPNCRSLCELALWHDPVSVSGSISPDEVDPAA